MSSKKDKKLYRFQREVTTITKTIEIIEVEERTLDKARKLIDSSEPVEKLEEFTRKDIGETYLLNIDSPYQDLT